MLWAAPDWPGCIRRDEPPSSASFQRGTSIYLVATVSNHAEILESAGKKTVSFCFGSICELPYITPWIS